MLTKTAIYLGGWTINPGWYTVSLCNHSVNEINSEGCGAIYLILKESAIFRLILFVVKVSLTGDPKGREGRFLHVGCSMTKSDIKNHGTVEWLRLEGTLKVILFQPPAMGYVTY